MAQHNIFDTKGTKGKRKKNIIRTKNSKGRIPVPKETSERYKSILDYYIKEKKTNKFIDKRKGKNLHKSSRKREKKRIFNLNDDSNLIDKHISTNFDNPTSDNSGSSGSNSGKLRGRLKDNRNSNTKNSYFQKKIEKKKLWKIKNYGINDKLLKFDAHFDDIRRSVLCVNNNISSEIKNGDLENRRGEKINDINVTHNTEQVEKLSVHSKCKHTEPVGENTYTSVNRKGKDRLLDLDKYSNKKIYEKRNKVIIVNQRVVSTNGHDGRIEHGSKISSVTEHEKRCTPHVASEEEFHTNKLINAKKEESGKIGLSDKEGKNEDNYKCAKGNSFCYISDESDNEIIEEIFNYNSIPINTTETVDIPKDEIDGVLERFLMDGNNKVSSYFINDLNEEKNKLPISICIENKVYELKDMVQLMDRHNFCSQKKLLYRIYYLNVFNNEKKKRSISHGSLFFSLLDYCVLNIYKCLRHNLKLYNLFQNYKDIILLFCHSMKKEVYLYISFLLLITFCKTVKGENKYNEFYKNKKRVLKEYIDLNKCKANKKYDVYIYSRILESAELFNSIFEKYYQDGGNVSYMHFSILFLALLLYPINKNSTNAKMAHGESNNDDNINNDDDINSNTTKGKERNITHNYFIDINKHNKDDEIILNKFLHLEEDHSHLEEEEEKSVFISYITEFIEYLFYTYFYSNNSNLVCKQVEQNYDYIFNGNTYADGTSIEECIRNIEHSFSFKCFSENMNDEEINKELTKGEDSKREVKMVVINHHLGIFKKKKELKNAVVLLNIYNIILENSNKKYSPAFFYLSFKILNTLLYYIIYEKKKKKEVKNRSNKEDEQIRKTGEERYRKNKDYLYELSFNTFNNLILFLKGYIDNDMNIYILLNHIVVPSLFYLYANYLHFIIKFSIKIDFMNIITSIRNSTISESLNAYNNTSKIYNSKKKEKYFFSLLYMYKLVEYSTAFRIKTVIHTSRNQQSIPVFTPKYVNNRNAKDLYFMNNNQRKFAEMKSLKKKIKQQKKLDYNEMKKENSYLIGLKAREEQERVRRNREKYKKIKLMAKQDVEEYNKMKTYTH
ncbi:conserved Plasmodium protein, unknown function [Plasmodium malariae]|uniref:Uncharacterized protein n=1 Tax=Plasmodium malariae TaxID=5858 RepID=A0A1A8WVS8_PLAMA|nr:conserved Plasmodium protein, unknown function [Plasmodium malariae]SBS97065.1 conserved Plasmodium protein, unknown function [Plasmodium malariae]SCN12848.1 conserved Plasmodium protein, unknown function [Plasmodium malariae]